ncbi:MAG: CopG family transcriptional regulator [Clostridia bacterium]|nr:CopG family transcriptional regulator [Clostridia bacterium]
MAKERRLGVIGIVVEQNQQVPKVNSILSDYAQVIVGRMGIPYRERGIAVIALTVDGTTDDIGALSGKLGQIHGIQVKSALVKH